jgi:mannose/fructose/N-acetylgalactosamine-specific phosphotransferase system component IIB
MTNGYLVSVANKWIRFYTLEVLIVVNDNILNHDACIRLEMAAQKRMVFSQVLLTFSKILGARA